MLRFRVWGLGFAGLRGCRARFVGFGFWYVLEVGMFPLVLAVLKRDSNRGY